MSKTLYVSDLDGTLLGSSVRISEYTGRVVNDFIKSGGIFSYATARSASTASKVTEGLAGGFPIIVYNGVFVMENGSGKRLLSNLFNAGEAQDILALLIESGVSPIVYSLQDGREKYSYVKSEVNQAMQDFFDNRKGDYRDNPVVSKEMLWKGEIFYFTCIDDESKLFPVYSRIKDKYNCVYQKDIYTGEQWLEIMPEKATKANAILGLKEYLGCDKIVSFGDGYNDISMFKISDECYAVENAVEELKQIATAVIESNDNDGVAKFIDSVKI